jgi:hypothetical protein
MNIATNILENFGCSCEIGTQTTIKSNTIKDLFYTKLCLAQKLKRLQIRYNRLKERVRVRVEKDKNNSEWKCMQTIKIDAANMNPRAIFILDQIKNYSKKVPRWSELTIRQCIAWRYSSPKGYEFPRNLLFKLPCKSTLSKYFGTGNDNLIKHRLMCEIKTLRASEKVCSLVVDDMAVRESISYSKAEDRIFGLETINQSQDKIGAKPVIANQLLCYVIYGLSTKYIIPASYFFHRQLTGKDLYKLTLEVLKMLSECGFFVIRIVGDNHKSHVALFKHFGNGTLENVVPHPYNPGLKFFLSFDYCHLVKNARNLFLDHDMASSEGQISANYLRELSDIQEGLITKPVRYLTKKHLYPSKMKVYLTVQIFSPRVTASLVYLADHGGEELAHFKDCTATVKYMETIYKFFQLHDVSNKTQHIHQRDTNTAPYNNINDARLSWLNGEFIQYINDIQSSSENLGIKGLSKETAEALIFTARSTSLCIKYLIGDLDFFYVLTRSFSSDPVKSLFANVRLRGGCNDLTDCRTAEYALRQILRSGLIKTINNSNAMNGVEYTSNVKLDVNSDYNDSHEIAIILNDEIVEDLENLTTFRCDVSSRDIESAATAFLCGYLIMKVQESVNCDLCLSLLRSSSLEKTNALLELIYNQDRGRLNYPNEKFVALIIYAIQIMVKILPNLPTNKVDFILKNVFVSYLCNNPIFQCECHFKLVCNIIVAKLMPAVLKNYCNLESQKIKKININTKKRKLLKLK